MELKDAILVLEQHNKWRKGDDDTPMINPTALGKAIDIVLKQVKNNDVLPDIINCKIMKDSTDKYRYCNHHHEIDDKHELVNFGDGEFAANKEAIPLLKALNEVGIKTRSHHIDEREHAWVCVILDNIEIEVKEVFERDADRTKYNGKKELLIRWRK